MGGKLAYKIYKHTFPNNKIYIGITSKENLKERWRNGNGYSNNNLMNKAIKKYGWKNVKHEILYENLTVSEAKNKEIELIEKYSSNNAKYGYNLSAGGESSSGYKHTKEQIEKQIKNRAPHVYTENDRENYSRIYKKIWSNSQYKERMKKIFKTRKHKSHYTLSQETKEKIKRTRTVKYIKCVETGEIFRGTRDASEKLKLDRRAIMRVLKKEYGFKSIKGLHFEYVKE